MSDIYVYMREPAVNVLGPGVRYVLWVQGCHRRCPGCVAKNSYNMEEGTRISAGALAMEIALSKAEGLTISGGEPFLQAEALADMIAKIKKLKDMGVIIYTGYTYEKLQEMPTARRLLEMTDLLIDGEYIAELDDGKSLRGSSNQRVIPLTNRYKQQLSEYGAEGRSGETFAHGWEVHKVGIPSKEE